MKKQKLLLNYVYWRPVGHVIEALKIATGIYKANKNVEISVILNNNAPIELTKACPWIKKTYCVDLTEIRKKGIKANCLKKIPKEWDYIISNEKGVILETKGNNHPKAKELVSYANLVGKIFYAKKGIGEGYFSTNLPKPLKYKISKVDFKLPNKAKQFAKKYDHKGEKICIMLGGSAGSKYYPDITMWIKIVQEINNKFPNCKIYLTGVKKSIKGRTSTRAYTNENIKNILKIFDNVVDAYDIGLWNQLALIEKCDVFISPHTGFGFLASCVKTPWVILSGGDWPEYLFNNFPFYSVLPDDEYYPYFGEGTLTKHRGKLSAKTGKIPSYESKRLERKIPEISEAIKLVMKKDFTYKKALQQQKRNIMKNKYITKKNKDKLMRKLKEKF